MYSFFYSKESGPLVFRPVDKETNVMNRRLWMYSFSRKGAGDGGDCDYEIFHPPFNCSRKFH